MQSRGVNASQICYDQASELQRVQACRRGYAKEPDKLLQNGFIENVNGWSWAERLTVPVFRHFAHACDLIRAWSPDCIIGWRHSAIGFQIQEGVRLDLSLHWPVQSRAVRFLRASDGSTHTKGRQASTGFGYGRAKAQAQVTTTIGRTLSRVVVLGALLKNLSGWLRFSSVIPSFVCDVPG